MSDRRDDHDWEQVPQDQQNGHHDEPAEQDPLMVRTVSLCLLQLTRTGRSCNFCSGLRFFVVQNHRFALCQLKLLTKTQAHSSCFLALQFCSFADPNPFQHNSLFLLRRWLWHLYFFDLLKSDTIGHCSHLPHKKRCKSS